MKLAYTIWTWPLKDKNDFDVSAGEIKGAGYDYIEHFGSLADMFFDDQEKFKSILEKHGLRLVNLYDGVSDLNQNHLHVAKKILEFLKRNGARFMNIQAPGRPQYGPDANDIKAFCNIVNETGKMAADYGVKLCVHPHFESMVEQEQEINFTAELLNPDYAGFCFDTAHLTLAGMDPVEVFKKYSKMIHYVHLKDAKKSKSSVEMRNRWRSQDFWRDLGDRNKDVKVFFELGQADIDFPGVKKVLSDSGYDGYLTVESDHTRYNNLESAIITRKYLKEKLGL